MLFDDPLDHRIRKSFVVCMNGINSIVFDLEPGLLITR